MMSCMQIVSISFIMPCIANQSDKLLAYIPFKATSQGLKKKRARDKAKERKVKTSSKRLVRKTSNSSFQVNIIHQTSFPVHQTISPLHFLFSNFTVFIRSHVNSPLSLPFYSTVIGAHLTTYRCYTPIDC